MRAAPRAADRGAELPSLGISYLISLAAGAPSHRPRFLTWKRPFPSPPHQRAGASEVCRAPSSPQRPRLGFSRCFLFAPTHAALASGDRGSRGSSAAGAALRAPTSSSSSAPQTHTHHGPSPCLPCALTRPLPRRPRPSGAPAPTSTASCPMHCTPLAMHSTSQLIPPPPRMAHRMWLSPEGPLLVRPNEKVRLQRN